MTAAAALAENPRLNRAQAAEVLDGNICRCGCYNRIGEAVVAVAEKLGGERRGVA
jgi:isoquinoline 1-oxidoreductase alpha subunit